MTERLVRVKGNRMVPDARLVTRLRSSSTRTLLALGCLVALAGFGFSRPLVNGYFASRDSDSEIVMVHVVEAPRGHLSGDIVVTKIDKDLSSPDVASRTVTGSLADGNVTLKIQAPFGLGGVLVGSLDGDDLTLSHGAEAAFTLYRLTAAGYQQRIAALNEYQSTIDAAREASQSVKEVAASDRQLDAAMKEYLAWGQQRIDREGDVRAWWNGKAKFYNACLEKVRLLAAAGVPKWKWQSCAIDVLSDAYARSQEVSTVKQLQQENAAKVEAIERGVASAPSQASEAEQKMRAVCPRLQKANASNTCHQLLNAWISKEPSLVPAVDVVAFRAIVPRVQQAIGTDARTSDTSNAELETVAAQIHGIYWAH